METLKKNPSKFKQKNSKETVRKIMCHVLWLEEIMNQTGTITVFIN